MSTLVYRSHIDGLRALAVVPVILFHHESSWLPGGFLGVDVFFVISGYLISSILLREYDDQRFSLARFWMRRVRRIFPVMGVSVLLTLVASYLLSFRPDVQSHAVVGFSSLFSGANFVLLRMAGDYWGTRAESSPFLHMWSLSVEEQFYLFYPGILYLVLRFARRLTVVFLGVGIVASFGLFLYVLETRPSAWSFYMLPTRGWELAVGCLVAVIHHHRSLVLPASLGAVFAGAGAALIVAAYFVVDGQAGLGATMAMPVLGAAWIVLALPDTPGVPRILSLKPIVFIGKISYSLYMWHWPVLVMGRALSGHRGIDLPHLLLALIYCALSLASYYLIERPARGMKHIGLLAVALMSVGASTSAYLAWGRYPVEYDASAYETVEFYTLQYDSAPSQGVDRVTQMKRMGMIVPPRDPSLDSSWKDGGIVLAYGDPTPQIVVLGDSHALMWGKVIDDLAKKHNLTIAISGMIGVSPFTAIPFTDRIESNRHTAEQRIEFEKKKLENLEQWSPRLVIISTIWGDRNMGQVAPLMDWLRARGIRVLLIEQPPMLSVGNNNVPQYLAFVGKVPDSDGEQFLRQEKNAAYERGRELVSKIQAQYDNCVAFRIADDLYGPDFSVKVLHGRQVVYYDDDHLSYQGTRLFESKLEALILSQLQQGPMDWTGPKP